MKNTVKTLRFGTMLGLTAFLCVSSSCATPHLPPLAMRTIPICKSLDGFCYNYYVPKKEILGIPLGKKKQTYKIEVEFKDKALAKTLYDMDFVLQQRPKP